MIKRIIGWLAERYPSHVFYSRDFMPEFRLAIGETNNPHITAGSTAMLGLAVAVGRTLESGCTLSTEFTGVTDGGRNIGNFLVTVVRLDD